MNSRQAFIPGSFRNLKKITTYHALLKNSICNCFHDEYKSFKTAENDPNYQSNTLRISNVLLNNNGIGGRIQFGNTYLNRETQPFVDSLGSIEGQPGGSYRPLRNRF
jgi:hypothetical protein